MPRSLFVLLFLAVICAEQAGLEAQDQDSPKRSVTLSDADLSPAQKAVLALIQKGATEDRRGDYGSAIKTFQDALKQLNTIAQNAEIQESIRASAGRSLLDARVVQALAEKNIPTPPGCAN